MTTEMRRWRVAFWKDDHEVWSGEVEAFRASEALTAGVVLAENAGLVTGDCSDAYVREVLDGPD